MKRILLSQGLVALVSDRDFSELSAFSWHAKRGRRTFYASRYCVRSGKRTTVTMHHQIMGGMADHRDGNGLNNQRRNLRKATRVENARNCSKCAGQTSSKYKGVSWKKDHGKWAAYIGNKSAAGVPRRQWLGYFATEELAAQAYDVAARVRFGRFARLNFVEAV